MSKSIDVIVLKSSIKHCDNSDFLKCFTSIKVALSFLDFLDYDINIFL